MRIFLDTNVFIRFYSRDNEEMYNAVEQLLALAEESNIQVATSTIVLTEIVYTLKSFYKLDVKTIIKHIDSILAIKSLKLVEKTDFPIAYKIYKKYGQKISDCLIVSQVPVNYKLCSFDRDLKKLIGKNRFIYPWKVKTD